MKVSTMVSSEAFPVGSLRRTRSGSETFSLRSIHSCGGDWVVGMWGTCAAYLRRAVCGDVDDGVLVLGKTLVHLLNDVLPGRQALLLLAGAQLLRSALEDTVVAERGAEAVL